MNLLENLAQGVEHQTLNRDGVPSIEFTFTVPEGQYFMMGDNRDSQ
jgi:hypothetical protein